MFNKKLKEEIRILKNRISMMEAILKLDIKCSNCGAKASYMVCRRFEGDTENLTTVDCLLCDDCIVRKNRSV